MGSGAREGRLCFFLYACASSSIAWSSTERNSCLLYSPLAKYLCFSARLAASRSDLRVLLVFSSASNARKRCSSSRIARFSFRRASRSENSVSAYERSLVLLVGARKLYLIDDVRLSSLNLRLNSALADLLLLLLDEVLLVDALLLCEQVHSEGRLGMPLLPPIAVLLSVRTRLRKTTAIIQCVAVQ